MDIHSWQSGSASHLPAATVIVNSLALAKCTSIGQNTALALIVASATASLSPENSSPHADRN